jgi:hypothetical protein
MPAKFINYAELPCMADSKWNLTRRVGISVEFEISQRLSSQVVIQLEVMVDYRLSPA